MKKVDVSLNMIYQELMDRQIAENPFVNASAERASDILLDEITKGDEEMKVVDRATSLICNLEDAVRYNAFVVGYKTAIALLIN